MGDGCARPVTGCKSKQHDGPPSVTEILNAGDDGEQQKNSVGKLN